jgi:hypothetical protein
MAHDHHPQALHGFHRHPHAGLRLTARSGFGHQAAYRPRRGAPAADLRQCQRPADRPRPPGHRGRDPGAVRGTVDPDDGAAGPTATGRGRARGHLAAPALGLAGLPARRRLRGAAPPGRPSTPRCTRSRSTASGARGDLPLPHGRGRQPATLRGGVAILVRRRRRSVRRLGPRLAVRRQLLRHDPVARRLRGRAAFFSCSCSGSKPCQR